MRVENQLCREYEDWCAENKLPYVPAEELSVELDYARDVTGDVRKIDRITLQLQWLEAFTKQWDRVTRAPGAAQFQSDLPAEGDTSEEELWDCLEQLYENIRQAHH